MSNQMASVKNYTKTNFTFLIWAYMLTQKVLDSEKLYESCPVSLTVTELIVPVDSVLVVALAKTVSPK